MKKIICVGLLTLAFQLDAISTAMSHRTVCSAPLLYKQIDYADQVMSFEAEPWISGMFDPQHTMENLGINGQSSMTLSQNGFGDINPEYLLLSTTSHNYTSTINLTPELFMFGALLHFYKQYEHVFFDIRSAILNCKTQIKIAEAGSSNGTMSDFTGQVLQDAHDAFTQSDWKYGKFGDAVSTTGLDDIQLMIGSSGQVGLSLHTPSYLAGFIIAQVPTGLGTRSEWLFEPQVGTNHWALGAGLDYMVASENGFYLVAGGNYRYIFANWETRSFDLTINGQWSRYLALDTIADLSTEGMVPGIPGINVFTQDALISGRSQVNGYARVEKKFEKCLFELSYNFLYTQQETITETDFIASGYGIYDVFIGGGTTTASTATIAQAQPLSDGLTPVTLVTSDLDLISGAQSKWMSSMVAARLQSRHESCTCGVGASVEVANSLQAISTWSVWFDFEILLH